MFKRTLALCLALTTTNSAATAGETLDVWRSDPTHIFDAKDVEWADMIWVARPLVIFADSPLNPIFAQQMKLLRAGQAIAQDRDIMIIVDTDPSAKTTIRENLHPKGFNWALIGKDGMVKLRKPFAWDMRELSRVIDKMPIRQQEMSKP